MESLPIIFNHYNEEVNNTPNIPDEYPFWLCQYGHTYMDSNYHEVTFNTSITRIEYVLFGKGVLNSKNYSCIAEKGDTYILHSGDDHNYYSDAKNPMDKIWINVNGVLASEIIKIYNLNDTILFKGIDSSPFILKMHEICKNNSDPYVIQAKTSGVFCEMIHFLARQHTINIEKHDVLDDIRSYIDLHIQDNISIEDLCKISNKSVNHTIRLFKNKFGITPHKYILELKMRVARTMLRSSDMSIEQIAESICFYNVGHFSSIFLQNTGMRPSEYRREFFKYLKTIK